MTTEPDYTLTIIGQDGGFVVHEGGVGISKAFTERREAEWWLRQHALFHQPRCCVCGSAVAKPDDPWEVYSVSLNTGYDWMHSSCLERFDRESAEGRRGLPS